jgi:hypothetical protein
MQVKSYDYIPMQKKFANQQKQDQQRRKKCPQKGSTQQGLESGLVSTDWLPTASLLCRLVPCFLEAFFLQ